VPENLYGGETTAMNDDAIGDWEIQSDDESL
ncbi:hypothetical protein F441_07634, partial [Phytophthora nicotianae CJ01A1]